MMAYDMVVFLCGLFFILGTGFGFWWDNRKSRMEKEKMFGYECKDCDFKVESNQHDTAKAIIVDHVLKFHKKTRDA